jgi:hypothetical protein
MKHAKENQKLDHGTQIPCHRTERRTLGKRQKTKQNIKGNKFNLNVFCGPKKENFSATDKKFWIGLKEQKWPSGTRETIQMMVL